MLTIAIPALIAAALWWHFMYPIFFWTSEYLPSRNPYDSLSIGMFALLLFACGALGGIIGYLLGPLVGLLFPQTQQVQTLQVESVRKTTRRRMELVIVGQVTVPQQRSETTFYYDYRNNEGTHTESADGNVKIIEEPTSRPKVTITSYHFDKWWAFLVALPRTTQYVFRVPKGMLEVTEE